MISYLKGKIIRLTEKSVVININGIGYEVACPVLFLEKQKAGQEVELFVHLHVREDAMELYGFPKQEELDFFKKLISVTGIGPKSALGIMSLAPVNELQKGIIQEDVALLTKVSGIGQKIAERLILELKNKFEPSSADLLSGRSGSDDSQAIDGLIGLGYSVREAREAIREVDPKIISPKDRLKAALKLLGKNS